MSGPPEPRSFEEIFARGYTLRTGDYLREGWAVFSGYPVGFLGFAFLLTLAANAMPFLMPIGGELIGVTIELIMMAGLALVAWQQMRRRPAAFSDFFPPWHTVGQLFICTVVVGLIMAVGVVPLWMLIRAFPELGVVGLLLIVLGFFLVLILDVYLLVAYTFSYMLIVDRHLGVWAALEGSRRVVGKHWWGILGLTIVPILVIAAGIVIGALLGLPFGYALSGFFPEVSMEDLPIEIPLKGGTLGTGVLVGVLVGFFSGGMVGAVVGVAIGGCMLGVAYAEIFGLASDRTGPPEQDAHTFPNPSSS